MKVPLNWLRDYVDPSLPPAQLAERLTLAGLEVAGVRVLGLPVPEGLRVKPEDAGPVWDRDKVVVARVLKTEKHPNADKLKLVTVEYGAAEPKVLVTGAPNINLGDSGLKVILGLAGTTYFDGHVSPKELKKLKPSKIRGVPSDAMAMSEFELGISEEHEGIIILEDDAIVGTPLADFMGDVVLELDVTPNMARCLSLVGIAREVAALTGKSVQLPNHTAEMTGEPIEGQVRVEIEDPALSRRYAAMLLKGVKIGPAPQWMQRRLTYAGMRPINNVVDVTNYVMLEWGQPLHAFDYDALVKRAGGKAPVIIVRPARPGEVLTTLDGVKRELTPDMLLIADEAGPIALAGVMGGAETEVTPATTNVLLESANFHFVSIRRTMKALNLPSEASARFSRGIHPELVRPAAERAAELMRQHARATVCRGIVDTYPAPLPPQVVTLDLVEARRILGLEMTAEDVTRILTALEFKVEPTGEGVLRATVPPHRLDVQEGAADLIEDLVRIHGYDRLPATLMADRLPAQHTNVPLVFEERVRDILVSAGLQEVINYALTTPEREKPLGLPEADYVTLLNPISEDRRVMRHGLLAGVLEVAQENLKHAADVRLFELGPVYLPRAGAKLPDEPRRLAVVLTGRRHEEFWADSAGGGNGTPPALDFFDLKGIVEALAADLHLPNVSYRPSQAKYLHPGRAAELVVGGQTAGHFGQMHPRVIEAYHDLSKELAGRALLVGEFDIEALQQAAPERYTYEPVPRFQAALRDIAIVVEESVTAEQLEAEIRTAGGELLRGVRLFDLYRGSSIPVGTKSLAYALSYQAGDRTLTDKEIDKAHRKIEDRLKHVLKAQIRGKDAPG
ncbi:MAG: phenylalanine--tRNA ligase subunit beta [Gemmataceae bacterium]|nr:phenylalanine--tRNA ligase subunit beta [Gemmataceae bacterium]